MAVTTESQGRQPTSERRWGSAESQRRETYKKLISRGWRCEPPSRQSDPSSSEEGSKGGTQGILLYESSYQ